MAESSTLPLKVAYYLLPERRFSYLVYARLIGLSSPELLLNSFSLNYGFFFGIGLIGKSSKLTLLCFLIPFI
jgi:hypothetical protein